VSGLFRAPARMSVIKLILARNTISFCGLNKLFAIARSSPGIFVNLDCLPVPRPLFSQKFPYPNPEYSRIFENGLVFLFLDRSFRGMFPFPAWNYLRSLEISKHEKLPAPGLEPLTFVNQADVLPLHRQFIYLKPSFFN
jgi:hypothetical protein